MAVSQDKCITDGNRNRPTDLEQISPSGALDSDGSFMGLPYWFCSVECYKKAVSKYIADPRYGFDKQAQDDEEYCERVREALVDYHVKASEGDFLDRLINPVGWTKPDVYIKPEVDKAYDAFITKNESEIIGAELELHNRLAAEWKYEDEQQAAKLEKESAKRREEIAKLEAEETERQALQEAYEEMLEPKPIPFEYRFDHTHVIAGSGHGKSTLLIKQFIDDLHLKNHPALVVIDPKGTMVDQLRRLQCFQVNDNNFYSRWPYIVIIDPTLFPPALNMFAPPKRTHAPHVMQQLENNTIALFQYVFSSKGSALTDKQMTCFSFAVSLLLTIPGATIHTFLDLMNDPTKDKFGGIRQESPFKPYVDKMGATAQRFFYDYFYHPSEYGETKRQIANRIFGMLRYPAFDAMFSTTENKLDMFECLQKGNVVLVSSPKSVLGAEGSQLFSRYIVALTLQAAFERVTVDKKTWHSAFLVIDEAQDVMDESKTPELLEQAREFKLGVTLAHQNIKGQLPEALFSSISANTRIKYAGTRSHMDASMMARDMHCEPEFIMNQKTGQFACYVGGMTDHPFTVQLQLGEIDDYEKMSDQEFRILTSLLKDDFGVDEKPEQKQEVPPAHLLSDTQTTPKMKTSSIAIPLDKPISHEGPTEAEPSRNQVLSPAETDKELLPQKDPEPNKPAPWKRK